MREILFKAKRIDNGEWVEGMLSYLRILKSMDVETNIETIEYRLAIQRLDKSYLIDPESICQYTGLKDKNGNMIWENDIIKYDFGEDIAVIRFGEYQNCCDSQKTGHIGFYVDWKKGYMRKDLGYWINMIDPQIVGNIFDNPELLEV